MRLWSPSFCVDFFEQRGMSTELAGQSADSICKLGYSRIKSVVLRVGRHGRRVADQGALSQRRSHGFRGPSRIGTGLPQRCAHV